MSMTSWLPKSDAVAHRQICRFLISLDGAVIAPWYARDLTYPRGDIRPCRKP